MATIDAVLGRNNQERTVISGTAAPGASIILSRDGHGAAFGRGVTDARGRFEIDIGPQPSNFYDWVVIEANPDGTANEAQFRWSAPRRQIVDG